MFSVFCKPGYYRNERDDNLLIRVEEADPQFECVIVIIYDNILNDGGFQLRECKKEFMCDGTVFNWLKQLNLTTADWFYDGD